MEAHYHCTKYGLRDGKTEEETRRGITTRRETLMGVGGFEALGLPPTLGQVAEPIPLNRSSREEQICRGPRFHDFSSNRVKWGH